MQILPLFINTAAEYGANNVDLLRLLYFYKCVKFAQSKEFFNHTSDSFLYTLYLKLLILWYGIMT